MKNKMFIVGMVSVLLVFGFVFTACSGDSEDDTWKETNPEDINVLDLLGTWEGSTVIYIKGEISIPSDAGIPLEKITTPSTSVSIPVALDIDLANPTTTLDATIDLNNILDALVQSPELKAIWADPELSEFLGLPPLNKGGLWTLLLSELSSDGIQPVENYRLKVTETMPLEGLLSDGSEEPGDDPDESANLAKVEINQDNTKIKITIPVNDELDKLTNPIKLDRSIIITLNKQG
jgi:hypothetical protein